MQVSSIVLIGLQIDFKILSSSAVYSLLKCTNASELKNLSGVHVQFRNKNTTLKNQDFRNFFLIVKSAFNSLILQPKFKLSLKSIGLVKINTVNSNIKTITKHTKRAPCKVLEEERSFYIESTYLTRSAGCCDKSIGSGTNLINLAELLE